MEIVLRIPDEGGLSSVPRKPGQRNSGEVLERLAGRNLVLDGAVSTPLMAGGASATALEILCLREPERVLAVHQGYANAGAGWITTHTFGANPVRLAMAGLGDQLFRICVAACDLARKAAGPDRLVAGSIGPLGPASVELDANTSRWLFHVQARALANEGVDLLVLETFQILDEIQPALDAAATPSMRDPGRIAKSLVERGASAVGANCGDHAVAAMEAAIAMRQAVTVPVIARPCAGLPQRVDGKLVYDYPEERFAELGMRLFDAGINAVGGCCGVHAGHVAALVARVKTR